MLMCTKIFLDFQWNKKFEFQNCNKNILNYVQNKSCVDCQICIDFNNFIKPQKERKVKKNRSCLFGIKRQDLFFVIYNFSKMLFLLEAI